MKLLSAIGLGTVLPSLLSTTALAAIEPHIDIYPQETIQLSQGQSYSDLIDTGLEQLKSRSYEAALTSFETAIAMEPNQFQGWLGKGEALYGLRRYAEAGTAYRQVTGTQP
ncbi:tetratricopeptide repeat protein [Leptolyngbyaceae cyanobacterium CCMR0082]|uniref:Tetratricopeptide repeat protein n=1 Tax=Adonisia turfae CCMR0082 TaxID=2304604 RepID=A0A6M0SFF4_9CYAN|nr:tetratricopeptide repeat protein [Adonisia turfae]NEZ66753.1 tetratricopeptide repeat protein [Adonisia turfae CCMR0082]